ncbi:XRE family transcriptional regulator [Pararhodobacter marinus]|uniref:XRE family transcriptional regulator n=2 Tax=Pararhodobacter marinus TaxID=2184063 RepID=A0A2U2CAT3_9RHOB|nr:XRE family transcriptional regulator [Pararhodobacter marinus]PWE28963.1 XRE family transcriptional regulator [Pararhodobacter marinus]
MSAKSSEDLVGANLRRARGAAGLSLAQVSALTGVSKAMLGQIERGESSPTLATLWKLCKGLQLPLTALIGPALAPSERGPSGDAGQNRVKDGPAFRTLFPFDPKTGCEVFLHDLAPHWQHLSPAHSEGVSEDVFVIDGAVEILVASDWLRVEAGQALRFSADQPHGYRNPLDRTSRFHNTIHYPS